MCLHFCELCVVFSSTLSGHLIYLRFVFPQLLSCLSLFTKSFHFCLKPSFLHLQFLTAAPNVTPVLNVDLQPDKLSSASYPLSQAFVVIGRILTQTILKQNNAEFIEGKSNQKILTD